VRAALAACLLAAPALAGDLELPEPVSDADYAAVDPAEARLGRLLFYDPVLSGNREVACATCHHPRFATSDGVSLGLGDGGIGLGPDRRPDPANPPEARIPRNAPALFNLGAHEFDTLFADGRIARDDTEPSGIRTPLGADMAQGFSGVLSAQTMFPVLSDDEMAGHYGENPVARAARTGRITGAGGAWDILARRVAAIPAYADRFAAAYDHVEAPDDIAFTDISDAIAAFMAFEWRSDSSPFDAHLRGQAPLTGAAAEGMRLFYGPKGCARCHAGPFQTDHGFHAMGEVQLGPGKAAAFERHARDTGRFRVTGDPADRYAFRTPSLRNVMHTAPYGHAGAWRDLRAFLAAHARPKTAIAAYERSQAVLPALDGAEDWWVMDRPAERRAVAEAATPWRVRLGERELDALVAFLAALSDPDALSGRLGIPEAVPSGLPVPR